MSLLYLVHGVSGITKVQKIVSKQIIEGSIDCWKHKPGVYTTPVFDFHHNIPIDAFHGTVQFLLDPSIIDNGFNVACLTESGGGRMVHEYEDGKPEKVGDKKTCFKPEQYNEFVDRYRQTYVNTNENEKEDFCNGEILFESNLNVRDKIIKIMISLKKIKEIGEDDFIYLFKNNYRWFKEHLYILEYGFIDLNNTQNKSLQDFWKLWDKRFSLWIKREQDKFLIFFGYEIEENGDIYINENGEIEYDREFSILINANELI